MSDHWRLRALPAKEKFILSLSLFFFSFNMVWILKYWTVINPLLDHPIQTYHSGVYIRLVTRSGSWDRILWISWLWGWSQRLFIFKLMWHEEPPLRRVLLVLVKGVALEIKEPFPRIFSEGSFFFWKIIFMLAKILIFSKGCAHFILLNMMNIISVLPKIHNFVATSCAPKEYSNHSKLFAILLFLFVHFIQIIAHTHALTGNMRYITKFLHVLVMFAAWFHVFQKCYAGGFPACHTIVQTSIVVPFFCRCPGMEQTICLILLCQSWNCLPFWIFFSCPHPYWKFFMESLKCCIFSCIHCMLFFSFIANLPHRFGDLPWNN